MKPFNSIFTTLALLMFIALSGMAQAQTAVLVKPLTEDQKIEKLIASVEKATNIQFYRNGSYHDATTAASHLRLKRKKAGNGVKTASDFIEKLASKSSMTGEEYKIKYSTGKEVKARDYFYAQLKLIEISK